MQVFPRVLLLRYALVAVIGLSVSLPLVSCGQAQQALNAGYTIASAFDAGDQSQVITAQKTHAYKVEVTVQAPVYKLLRDDREGLPHQRFLIVLNNGTTVLIAHDVQMAPRVPIKPGDVVTIHGEYIWNKKGGVIHWTHHTDTPRHAGGWIDFNGQRYQ
jgi:translation initiation factor IF-1